MTIQHIKINAALLLVIPAIHGAGAWYTARAPKPVPTARVASTALQYPVVVSSKTLRAGEPIPAGSLSVAQLPIQPAGAFSETAEVVGKTPVVTLGSGVPLIGVHLASGLATQVEIGERAVAVTVDEVIGVGNRVMPGDFVDVFVVLKRDGDEVAGTQARLLLSKLRVLAFGPQSVSQAAARPEEGPGGKRAEPIRTAVLAVPVDSVNPLAVAQQSGRLLLALRHPADPAVPTENLFPPIPPVLSPVAGKVAPGETSPVDAAAAGLALAGLAGPVRAVARAAAAPPMAVRQASPIATGGGVEVIRAGKRTVE